VNPCWIDQVRTVCRTSTTSLSPRTASASALATWAIVLAGVGDGRGIAEGLLEQLHPALHVERGADSLERQPQLDERDGHRGLHPHHHRLRIEDAAHPGDVRQHAADEGVDDVERADVDED